MAKNLAGEETRASIVNSCKMLFYEYGFTGTTYSAILKEAEINPGTFSYHFGSRENVAKEIYGEMVRAIQDYTNDLFAEKDADTRDIISHCIFRKLKYQDEKIYRFSSEVCASCVPQDTEEEYRKRYKVLYGRYTSVFPPVEADLFFAASCGMVSILEPYLYSHRDTIPFETSVKCSTEAYLLNLPMEQSLKALDFALPAMDDLVIINHGFDLQIYRTDQ